MVARDRPGRDQQASGSKTSENLTLPGTGSTKATELLEDNLPEQAYGSNPLVIESSGGKLTEPKYANAIEETVEDLEALPEVNSAVSPLSQEGAKLLSKDQTIGYIPVVLGIGPGEINEAKAQRILDAAGRPRRPACKPRSAATSASSSPNPRPRSARRSASARR